MATDIQRPAIGACVRVLPTLTRDYLDGRPSVPDPNGGECGIVSRYNVPAPRIDRATMKTDGTVTWDLGVTFLHGYGCAYDMDEVEITHGSPWYDEDGAPWHTAVPADAVDGA
jgi:hypothetical protein